MEIIALLVNLKILDNLYLFFKIMLKTIDSDLADIHFKSATMNITLNNQADIHDELIQLCC